MFDMNQCKEGDNFVLYDQQNWEEEAQGELKVVFEDGLLYNEQNLNQIRGRLWAHQEEKI